MLLTPRSYQLSQTSDRGCSGPATPFVKWSPSLREQNAARRQFFQMLLVHQTGSVKVGQTIRYAVFMPHLIQTNSSITATRSPTSPLPTASFPPLRTSTRRLRTLL